MKPGSGATSDSAHSGAASERPPGVASGQSTGVTQPFRRVLVANRGEIALRVIRTLHEAGVEAVAVYSDADAEARHVCAADQAVRIGPPAAADSYLRGDTIIDAALATQSDAIHPGYGFLSEQASFAAACRDAGVVFVGPAPETLADLGDKIAARRAAKAVGVPTVPGTFDALELTGMGGSNGMRAISAAAAEVGWPLLVKASAGGGGRGMRRVDDPKDLSDAVASASREAKAAFGDGTIYLERYIDMARHVEVQLLGDAAGGIAALGERDCSVQRRHQKLVEEAPAPGLTKSQRSHLHRLAVTVARTAGLRNAATAEFLLVPDGQLYFLEINARLQVEHGVTELVTGLDLVREQLWLAAGWPLSTAVLHAAERAAEPERHAIEMRISAEDPAGDFAPNPGTLTVWREPSGPGVRVDSGVAAGERITAEYDPLLAKILTVDLDRPAALARMRRALGELEIGGIRTTLPFHLWLLGQPDFIAGRVTTDLVARSWDPGQLWEEAAHLAAEALLHAHAESGMRAPLAKEVRPGARESLRRKQAWAMAARREAVQRWP